MLTGCHEAGRIHPEQPTSLSTGTQPDSIEPSERFHFHLTDLICRIYRDWPMSAWSEELAGELALIGEQWNAPAVGGPAPRSPGQRAVQRCPEVIPPESLPASGRLPVPVGPLSRIPDSYDFRGSNDPEEERARYEWTAIGLGCLGLRSDVQEEELRGLGERFLEAMGYTLQEYVQVSLEMDDPHLSDRIFQRILFCADWPGSAGERGSSQAAGPGE